MIAFLRRRGVLILGRGSGTPFAPHYGGDGLSVSASNRDYLRHILEVKLDSIR